MGNSKIETVKGLCVVAIVKDRMQRYGWEMDEAYAHFLTMELHDLLMDTDTRLFLETNAYLCKCAEIEDAQGVDALYRFINPDLAEKSA